MGGATCQQRPDPKAREQALLHYDIGTEALQGNNDPRAALLEYQKALQLDPDLAVAHNGLGVVYHLSYAEKEKAAYHYQRAIELNPKFSEAHTNLGNLYLDQGRYAEAIPLYEKALSDILYKSPFIAANNLGWCYYKQGQVQQAIDHIRSALIPNPKFCLGHRNLGVIYSETNQPEKALASFADFVKHCPEVPDARYRYARALLASGNADAAKKEFSACAEKARGLPLGLDCQRLLDQLSPTP